MTLIGLRDLWRESHSHRFGDHLRAVLVSVCPLALFANTEKQEQGEVGTTAD